MSARKAVHWELTFSTQSATLPAAAKTGNLYIAPNSVVESLIYDEKTNRVMGVRVIDNETLKQREYFGKLIFLCASTLGSTQIMMNSKSRRFPSGIANSSGVLGHYLMDHNYNAVVTAEIEGYDNEYYSGDGRPLFTYQTFITSRAAIIRTSNVDMRWQGMQSALTGRPWVRRMVSVSNLKINCAIRAAGQCGCRVMERCYQIEKIKLP